MGIAAPRKLHYSPILDIFTPAVARGLLPAALKLKAFSPTRAGAVFSLGTKKPLCGLKQSLLHRIPTSAGPVDIQHSGIEHLNFGQVFGLSSTSTADLMASEEDVGILQYANSVPGFHGILKQRFSDFIVNEIDLDGNVVHLTELQAPAELLREETGLVGNRNSLNGGGHNEMKAGGHDGSESMSSSFDAIFQEFESLAGNENAELLKNMVGKADTEEGEEFNPILLSPDADKAHRKEIHMFVKSRLPFLVTDVVDGPTEDSKCIRIRYLRSKQVRSDSRSGSKRSYTGGNSKDSSSKRLRGDHPFDKRGLDNWPSERGKYLQFYLYKENKDTQDAIAIIGRMLGVQPKSFGFAGTKDKRAVTTQRATVFKQFAGKVAALNERLYGIKVGNFSYVQDALCLGQLLGNRFNITLRGVAVEDDGIVVRAAEGLGKSGFINYFGLQRFGSASISTHSIGVALLRGEWKQAVELILSPRVGEQPEIEEARNYYKRTSDADGALLRMPRYMVAERAILLSLKKSPGNFLQAITSIPRPVRLLYVHSYQSLLWNHAASFRAKTYGVEDVVEGDIVFRKEVDCNGPRRQVDEQAFAKDVDGIVLEMDDSHEHASVELLQKARVVTHEDVKLGRYSVQDVLLPLPGSMILYPGHEVANLYHELAKKDTLDLSSSKHNVKEFSLAALTGGYRHFIEKPRNLEWKLVKYSDPAAPLAETDVDKILGNPMSSSRGAAEDHTHIVEDPKAWTALQLCFSLPSSCYATMAIRELLKISTSVTFHKSLSELPTPGVQEVN